MTKNPAVNSDTAWIYTDGACSGNPGAGGWAFCLAVQQEGALKIFEASGFDAQTTNNQMEMEAVAQALQFLKERGFAKNAFVFTDSSYVAQGLESWIWGWIKKGWKKADGSEVANVEIWKRLHELRSQFVSLKLEVVPGHADIPGNEKVDKLAVAAYAERATVPVRESADSQALVYSAFSELPQLRRNMQKDGKKSKSSSSKKALYYLSLVDGRLEKHQTWAECESRVKGTSGAKFKKVTHASEEAGILKAWGL